MRIAYLDCFSGISGDMFLGALVDAGVPFDLLQETVRALNIGATLECSRVTRNGIAATKIDVLVNGVKDMPREEFHEQEHTHANGTTHSHEGGLAAHDHLHSHEHEHPHAHHHTHEVHAHSHEHGTHTHRGLREIREIISAAPITDRARATALHAFELLGRAEAKIHNRDLETVHFHEVGSADAIVDIVCAAVGADWLNIDEWRSSALNTGSGVVHCAHGTLPVPAPATLEILKGAPIYSSGIKKELVTPTGAAILRTLVTDFTTLPGMRVDSTGYGAGARDFADTPNVLRITIGEVVETDSASTNRDTVAVLEANVDDSTPEVIGYTLERLFEAGALDAFTTPVQMKKSRPGVVITVLAKPQDEQRMVDILLSETSTIGVRTRHEQRIILDREHVTVRSEWGPLRVKVARLNGRVMNFSPEYEDCRAAALAHGVPLKQVLQEAVRLYLEHNATASRT